MSLRAIGAGVGRTGTFSLHLGLSVLLGQKCYHMLEVTQRPEHVSPWEQAFAEGSPPSGWESLFDGYGAAVGGPTSAFWRELQTVFPEALVVLSVRDTDEWWRSFSQTVAPVLERHLAHPEHADARVIELGHLTTVEHLTTAWSDESAAKAAYEAHNDEVRSQVPADRLVEWSPADGWGPLCRALDVPVPEEPFPHRNTTAELRAMAEL
ncbi:sulfotransferase family protein [Streptomyces sp. NPDC000351]|uniref:sulfotransferase family protein n=1 Tax=Streptomyces sp. NPDC000351 TaxID=3154250 RepID=UPI00332DC64A